MVDRNRYDLEANSLRVFGHVIGRLSRLFGLDAEYGYPGRFGKDAGDSIRILDQMAAPV
jgi:hypothetical protein